MSASSPSRRRVLAGASLTAGGALLGALSGAPALAAAPVPGRTRPGAGGDIEVVVRPDSVLAPSYAAPGAVTFTVSTPSAKGLSLLLITLRVPLAEYLADVRAMSEAERPEDVARAAAKVEADAVNRGGAVLTPGRPVSFTAVLPRGRHHLIGYAYSTPGAVPVAHPLTVTGRPNPVAPRVDGLIVQTRSGFSLPRGRLRAEGDHLVVNRSGQLNEAVLIPVRSGTTGAEIDAVFAALASGTRPPSMPFTGDPSGLAPLSPGRVARLRPGAPPGEYLLTSWVTSTETGRPRAFGGYHRLVRVGP
ncbi:hypothetical protein [Streptomyces sp. NPDC001985]|uniref:hypothetical protein n=1 Tax=Streptomyces sp. NPDC001985 TaxID=3154406 RepID=UPI00331BDA9E